MDADVVVVGAGPAGLAVAACLKKRGVETIVLDRGQAAGQSWRTRYDRLHLHTPRAQSRMPDLPIPRRFGRWVSKDDMAQYIDLYARHHGIVPRFGTELRRLDRDGDRWVAMDGDTRWTARQVVIATGYSNSPARPLWPGEESFPGDIVHAADYTSPMPYAGRSVLVVGAGNTGAEIAADLTEHGARDVRLAVRTPPNVIPRQLGPVPTTVLAIGMEHAPPRLVDPVNRLLQRWALGDLTRFGMPAPEAGVVEQARRTKVTPTIDVGLVAALRRGDVTPVPALECFDAGEAVLADGSRFAPDAVIAATGYTTGLDPIMAHLGVLDPRGRPLATGPRALPQAPGLRFIGMSNPLKGQLFQIRLHATAIAKAVAAELRED
ncbi:NAD(P)/FAD-dependent oxidoreductase [Microbacterium sp. 4R-513]|uniref:flavin-containing monooxygenase n=1 Tax=Microbacterium sp. 4R-513 TaxID=2567934 RepID=UPI0019CFE0BE|nr:NAD(P)/FAD-dependent oxidoreductase [Microbacterium sp. 4R-513]